DAEPGELQHVDVVRTVANCNRLAQRHVETLGKLTQRLGLAYPIEDWFDDVASEASVNHIQLVRSGEFQSELGHEPIGEDREAAAHDSNVVAQPAQGT